MVDVSGPCTAPPPGEGGERRLRRDAEANRLRILQAAGRVFAERGLEVTMDDIADAAGVGVGTVYRRFPDKQELIDALFGQRLAQVAAVAEEALEIPDAWEAVVTFLRTALQLQVNDRGLAELLRGRPGGRERVDRARARIDPLVDRLVIRAQADGRLRPDVTGPDLAVVGMMLALIADRLDVERPEVWERYFELLVDGLRTSRDGPSPLGPPPLEPGAFQRFLFASP